MPMSTIGKKILILLSPILFPFYKLYWKIFKPQSYGSKVIIENNGKYLLIKNNYGYGQWTFVGGRIDKGESPDEAAKREVMEEVGLKLSNLRFIQKFTSTASGKRDHINIFYGAVNARDLVLDKFEIKEAKWFEKNQFPELGPVAKEMWGIFENSEFY
jgi:8-oxo-dGTP pyrophosphatase MutT (NUDIX family)